MKPDWLKAAVAKAAADSDHDRVVSAPPMVKGRVLIVDGDYLAYYAAGNDDCEAGRARLNAIEKMDAFRALSGSERIVVHLTAPGSSKGDRFLAATVQPYQGQRGGHKPKNWAVLREWMETYKGPSFKTKMWNDREADDGMAYHAAVLGPELAVIATADKDMRMFPGVHMDWQTYAITHAQPTMFRTENEITGKEFGHVWFWQQMLQGDQADHIPGLPFYLDAKGKAKRLGEKTAAKFLKDCNSDADALDVVAELYQGYYEMEWADRLAEQAVLLWMREDKAASVDDWMRVVPEDSGWYPRLRRAADDIIARIAEQYRIVAELEKT